MMGCLPCWGGRGVVGFLALEGWVCLLVGVEGVWVVVGVGFVTGDGLNS